MTTNNTQQEVTKALELVQVYPTKKEAAEAMGLSVHAFGRRLRKAKDMGLDPALAPAPITHGMEFKSTTVQYDSEGNVIQEWRRLLPESEGLRAFVDTLITDVKGKGRSSTFKPKKIDKQDLMKEICLQDIHFGRLCDKAEVGVEYNLETAKRGTVNTAKIALKGQSYGKITVVFGGDITHQDDQKNATPKSGHTLDVDGRYYRTVAVASAALKEVVKEATKHAPQVEVICLAGNHDLSTGICMRYILDAYFSECENVSIAMEPSPRVCRTWGNSMIVWGHGDCVRPNKWVEVVASEFPQQWAATIDRHCHLGHRHSKHNYASQPVASMPGLLVSFLPSLCPPDEWAVSHGYVGVNAGTETFIYHEKWGMIENGTIPLVMALEEN